MTNVNQVADDLQFVRQVVEIHDRRNRPPQWLSVMWAGYVVTGYTLIDFARYCANWFFIIGGIAGALLTSYAFRKSARRTGTINRTENRKNMLGSFGGAALAIMAVEGLALVIPELRGLAGTQVLVVMFGLMYYLGGVYGPPEIRHLMFGGPIIMAGAICVGLIPRFGWTGLGIMIAACILLPVFRSRQAHHE